MINAVFAVDRFGGMGFNGTLPWPHNAPDLANFQKLTTGHVIVIGRNSWDDPKIPKPLPNRIVYVVSNRTVNNAGRIFGDVAKKVLELEKQHSDRIIWVVGGPTILKTCIDLFDEVYLTHFKDSYKIDTKIDLKSFLVGFNATHAKVAKDFNSTFIRYAPIFNRTKTST